MKSALKGRVFHTLDALRGVAAIGVLMFHMGGSFTPLAVPGGYLAVDLFFMMSGVVLAHAYEPRFREGMGTLDFMRARLIRLYPLYLVGTALGILVTLASMHGRNSQNWDPSSFMQAATLALFFLPNFSGHPVNEIFPLNIPCWSLFFELLVNLLFVIFWPLLTSRRLLVISVLTGAVVGWAAVHAGNLDQGSTGSSFGIGLARTVFGFSVGVLIARQIPQVQRGQNNFAVLAIVAAVGIAIAGWPRQEFRALWDAVCVLVAFPLLVCFGTLIDPGSWLRKVATFLGVTSYAIYLLHSPVSSILNSATRSSAVVTAPTMGFVVLAALLACCWLIDRYFDMPIRGYLNRLTTKMQASRSES